MPCAYPWILPRDLVRKIERDMQNIRDNWPNVQKQLESMKEK